MTYEEAINAITQFIENYAYGNDLIGLKMAIETLKKERPHGEWEFIGENLFKCTNCGYIADADYLRKWKVHTYDAEFPTACLKCGADMRKEGDEK